MVRYEYRWAVWKPNDSGANVLAQLNAWGAEGWEAVGLSNRAVAVPAAGMGASAVPEIAVLLKRPLGEA